jgi:hypothetical protein
MPKDRTKKTIFFQPINDQVLLKMDVKKKSILERGVKDKPTVLPSGHVIRVGRGTFIPGTGFIEPQVQEGEHVAVSMAGEWTNLPLDEDPDEIYISVSESLILGKLEGADKDTRWFKTADDAPLVTH